MARGVSTVVLTAALLAEPPLGGDPARGEAATGTESKGP